MTVLLVPFILWLEQVSPVLLPILIGLLGLGLGALVVFSIRWLMGARRGVGRFWLSRRKWELGLWSTAGRG